MKRIIKGFLLLFCPVVLFSASFDVDSAGDGSDINLGDGICEDGTGYCTLRAAIEEANSMAGFDEITFSYRGIIVLTKMLPPLNSDMTIQGNGVTSLTISGNNDVRIFYAKNGTITINDLTLANGMALGGSGSDGGGGGMGAGGALLMHEGKTGTLDLHVNNVVFDNNQAKGGDGGVSGNGGGGGMGGDGGMADGDDSGGGGGGFFGIGGESESDVDVGGGGGGFFLDGSDSDNDGDGGDGGGGGGGTDPGNGGDTPFIGENNGADGDTHAGGNGGFGGGGGGMVDDGEGGDGGFGGGGGGNFSDDDGDGGDGGFGGGGGSATGDDDADGGDGGFGGGGGAGDDDNGSGGFGAGDGDNDDNGGGGLGAGGAVFIVSGSLTAANVTFSNNTTNNAEGGDNDNGGESLAGAIYVYSDPDSVNMKNNAKIVVLPGSGLTFTDNAAMNDMNGMFTGDGVTINNSNDIHGPISGIIRPDNPSFYTLVIVPTIGEWGLLILALLLLNFGVSANISLSGKAINQQGKSMSLNVGSILYHIPFDQWRFHLKEVLATAAVLFIVIFILWGEILFLDTVIVFIAATLLINLFYLLGFNPK
jgi:hypothetical protein